MNAGACAIEEVDEFIRIAFETEVVEFELFAAVAEENGDPIVFPIGVGPGDAHVMEADVAV